MANKSKRYVILFRDGSMSFFTLKPSDEETNQRRVFEVDEDATVADLCEWIGHDYRHKKFKELVTQAH